VGTYFGLFAASLLTWTNLHFKIAQEPDSGHRKILTPAGRASRILLVLSFLLTIASSVAQNIADSHLRTAAELRGTQAIQDALESQHNRYIGELEEQFEGKNGVIPKISEETRQLKAASEKTTRTAEQAVEAVTGGKSYPWVRPTFSSDVPPKIGLSAEIHHSQNPAGEFSYIVEQVDQCPFSRTEHPIQAGTTGVFRIGKILPVLLSPAIDGDTYYQVRMQARNGNFLQCIVIKPNSSHNGWIIHNVVANVDWLGFKEIEKETIGK